jgi:hypothetical protein
MGRKAAVTWTIQVNSATNSTPPQYRSRGIALPILRILKAEKIFVPAVPETWLASQLTTLLPEPLKTA